MRGGRGGGPGRRPAVRGGRPGVGAAAGPRLVARRAGRGGLPGPLARALVRRLRAPGPQRAAQGGAAAVAQRGPGGAPRREDQPPEVSPPPRRPAAAVRRFGPPLAGPLRAPFPCQVPGRTVVSDAPSRASITCNEHCKFVESEAILSPRFHAKRI